MSLIALTTKFFSNPFAIVSFICFLFVLTSCKEEFKPMSIEQMSSILTEMHIAESYSEFVPKDSNNHSNKNEDSLKKFVAAIFKENHTNQTAFNQNINWYKTRPDLLDSIYQQVLTNISIWQMRTSRPKN